MKKKKTDKFNDKVAVVLSAILGAVVFLLIYGPYSLDVTNDAWILAQCFESDIIQNYAGWTQYRISSWQYPLGMADMIAYGDGTYITYTDSIPYVAIVCKLFRDVLPDTFQYFGWFTLGCFVLQGIGACLLLKRRCRSYVGVLAGEIFFLTAPELMVRAFKHTALGAHWFSLFALYYYLEYRSNKYAKLPWQLILLSTLTVGIHPYFLPIVMIFVLLSALEAFIKKYPIWKVISFLGVSVASPYGMGVIIGALGNDVKNTRGGYGYAALDLNTLFNPKRYGGYVWSHILPLGEEILDMKEGFYYLGLGIILLTVVSIIVLVVEVMSNRNYIHKIADVLHKNRALICGMLFMTIFALSNKIIWNDNIVFSYTLPEKILEYANIFRASGRMFYPVYYLIMLAIIYYIVQIPWEKVRSVILLIAIVMQVTDMRDVLIYNHNLMKENYDAETIMDDKVLADVKEKEVLVLIGTENFELQRAYAVWAAQHDMGICYSIANTGKYGNCEMFAYTFMDNMANGLIQDEVVYATLDEDIIQQWRAVLKERQKEYVEYKRGLCYFVYTE